MKSSVEKNNLHATTTSTSTSYNNKNKRGTWAPDERNKTEEGRNRRTESEPGSTPAERLEERPGRSSSTKEAAAVFSADGGSADDHYRRFRTRTSTTRKKI